MVILGNGSHQIACSGQTYNATNFPAGVWTFLFVTYDGTNIRFYRDGNLINTVSQTVDNIGTSRPAFIGYVSGYYANISIDDVRLYNRTLAADEIHQLAGS